MNPKKVLFIVYHFPPDAAVGAIRLATCVKLSRWNGYDEEDFRLFNLSGNSTISYLGTFYFGRTPKSFLHALGELVKEGQLDKSWLEVRFVGDVR